MGMDRNSVIGFVLLALLFFGYFYYTRQGQASLEKQRQHIQDSIALLKPKSDTSVIKIAGKKDSTHGRPLVFYIQQEIALWFQQPHQQKIAVPVHFA